MQYFQSTFKETKDRASIIVGILEMKQRVNETISLYAARLRDEMLKANLDDKDQICITQFIRRTT